MQVEVNAPAAPRLRRATMRRGIGGRAALIAWCLACGLAAAPAATSYREVTAALDALASETNPAGAANNDASASTFAGLRDALKDYAAAETEDDRRESLAAVVAARGVVDTFAAQTNGPRLAAALDAWLAPRVKLADAERGVIAMIEALPDTNDATVKANRAGWLEFIESDLGSAIAKYESATTVRVRREALAQLRKTLDSLDQRNAATLWPPAATLRAALDDLFRAPNFTVAVDPATVAPWLERLVVESGPVERKGYISQVTAGQATGYGFADSNDGVAFYNRQLFVSVTPIHDFYQQMFQDQRGRRAAKMYYFYATTTDQAEAIITTTISTRGLAVDPNYNHNVDVSICTAPTPEGGAERSVAALLTFGPRRIAELVRQNALPRLTENVIQEALDMGRERADAQIAPRNENMRKYLIGDNTLVVKDLTVKRLELSSTPDHARARGWAGVTGLSTLGADEPRPVRAEPALGAAIDAHLPSVLTAAAAGAFARDPVKSAANVLITTGKAAAKPGKERGFKARENVSFADFMKAADDAKAFNDTKGVTLRIKKPSRAPEFAVDAKGRLVAIVHDLQVDLPVPPKATAGGGVAGPPAKVYRIIAPVVELALVFKITPGVGNKQARFEGKVEDFDLTGAKIFAINDDENKAVSLTAFSAGLVLGLARAKVMSSPIDTLLPRLDLRGFEASEIGTLDPSGWLRVVLVRDPNAPVVPFNADAKPLASRP